MMGQTFQPEFFPIMPVMTKTSRANSDTPQHCSILAAPSQLVPGDLQAISSNSPRSAQPPEPDIRMIDALKRTKQALFARNVCQSRFLISIGLERHMQSHNMNDTPPDQVVHRASKIPRLDIVQAVLARPALFALRSSDVRV